MSLSLSFPLCNLFECTDLSEYPDSKNMPCLGEGSTFSRTRLLFNANRSCIRRVFETASSACIDLRMTWRTGPTQHAIIVGLPQSTLIVPRPTSHTHFGLRTVSSDGSQTASNTKCWRACRLEYLTTSSCSLGKQPAADAASRAAPGPDRSAR